MVNMFTDYALLIYPHADEVPLGTPADNVNATPRRAAIFGLTLRR